MPDAERWQQIDQLFEAALERPPAARPAFLAEACGEDGELHREVSSLLAAAARAEDFIEASPVPSLLGTQGKRIGQTLGHYQLDALLGVGGMGEVYRAHDLRLGRGVAVKVLPPHLAQNHEAIRRFEREARAVAALSHPNILAIHDFGVEGETSYAVMELLEGETLQARLARGTLPWPEAVAIAQAVAEGLAAAHAKGIIHRDIKAANIFLTTDGRVKILDFGIARVKAALLKKEAQPALSPSGNTTKEGTLLGTPSYMSPEQVRAEKAEAPSDIFSLGCLLVEMLTGTAPFTRPTVAETLAAILRDEPPNLAKLGLTGSKLPSALDRIARRCLAKAPDDRYQNAQDLAAELAVLVERPPRSSGAFRAVVAARAPQRVNWLQLALTLTAVALLIFASLTIRQWRQRAATPLRETLAVLPLTNASQNAELDYLCDGITENLTNKLAALPQLRVLSWSAAARYKGQAVDPRAVGQQLNARRLLLGKLTQHGDQLTIAVEMVDAADGSHLWGAMYQLAQAEALDLHASIAQQIAANLNVHPTAPQQAALAKRHTANPEAWQLYLKGRFFWNQRTSESFQQAIPFFEQALRVDPQFALAYAGLADTYVLRDDAQMDYRAANEKAKEFAQRALQLDDSLAEAHATLAFAAFMLDWDWARADAEFRQTLQLNPNYATAHHWYAEYLVTQGRFDEALAEINQARELDPLSPAISKDVGVYLYFAHRFPEAVTQLRKTAELHPDFKDLNDVYSWLANAYEQQGNYPEMLRAYLTFKHLSKAPAEELQQLESGFAQTGIAGYRRAKLAILQHKLQNGGTVRAISVAHVYSMLGERDAALEWLDKAYADRHYGLTYLKVDPRFDRLRSDARFQALLRRIGLV
mgnify:CR=1 FL=1